MSKKARFKSKGSKHMMPTLPSFGLPKTVLEVTERGETKTYRSFNSLASAISKLAANSALPSWVFYDLLKEGEASYNDTTLKAWAWTPEWNDEFEKKEKEAQSE